MLRPVYRILSHCLPFLLFPPQAASEPLLPSTDGTTKDGSTSVRPRYIYIQQMFVCFVIRFTQLGDAAAKEKVQ